MTTDTNSVEKVNLSSQDIAKNNRMQLKALFPSVFTETRNDKGEQVEAIDFEKLKAEFGSFSDLFENRRECYGMDWSGKKDALKLIQQPSYATLKPVREESVNFDSTENLFIEGDNLEVLKLLQKSYYGKVKMIYIDPPYNTGKEFIYPDNYAESLETYLAYAGLVDANGKRFSTNTSSEGRFHTRWLNMMYPRLYLARDLLREDGVIFISIDDHEVRNLRALCDEICGEENFVTEIIWKKRSTPPNDRAIGSQHEYILLYCKNFFSVKLNLRERTEQQIARYKNPDNHPKGVWSSGDLMANVKGGRYVSSLYFPIINPNTSEEHYPSSNGNWRFNRGKIQQLLENDEIYFGEDGKGRPKLKRFLCNVKSGITWTSLWDFTPLNTAGSQEMENIFGNLTTFENPKPTGLILETIKAGTNPDDIILDFFSGSSTTAHAVLDLNKEDGGNRKFIMVQLPEPCDKNSEAFKAGYKNITEIGKERIRRVIKKIQTEHTEKEQENQTGVTHLNLKTSLRGTKQSVRYDESQLRNSCQKLDLGFKVLKLDQSNFKIWDGSDSEISETELAQQLEPHIDHINPKATQEDILYELLLKAGFLPTEKVETLKLADKTVFSIAEGILLICLEDEITRNLIDAIAEAEPIQFICLDKGFQGNDQLKANAVQTFNARNQGRDKAQQIVFRTV